MKTVLCTAGTSIAQGTEALRGLQQRNTAWDDPAPELEEQIRVRLREIDLATDDGRSRASAEINSLNRLGLSSGDKVVFLGTDTADGRACATALARVLTSRFGMEDVDVRVVRVRGLQVRDAKRLREEGLPNLIEEALRFIGDPQLRYGGEIILNPTGGFKGVVPFLTVLGMLFGLRTVYIFEFANSLISLPPLPISFDLRLYERALPAIERVQGSGAIAEAQFFGAIEGFDETERDLFAGFIERERGLVTLSTLGLVLLGMDSGEARTIRMLPAVRDKWNSADPVYRAEMERCLIRSMHPLWRRMHGHPFQGSSLQIFGERSGPRIAGIIHEDAFYVTSFHLVDRGEHGAYEASVSGRAPSDFRLGDFVDWQPSSDLKSVNDRLLAGEHSRLEELARENAELKTQLRDAGQPYRDEIRRLETSAAEVKALNQTISSLRMEIKALRFENEFLDRGFAPTRTSEPTE